MKGTAANSRGTEVADEVLVERFLQGDERAFDRIYQRYAKQVGSIVYRLLGQDLDFDDIVQETFVTAAETMDRLRDRTRLRPWLLTIAVRKTHRVLRKRRSTRMLKEGLRANPVPMWTPGVRGRLEHLRDVVDSLSPKLREPWIVHRVQGETLAETSAICGVPLTTLKRRLQRAEELIQKRLTDDT